MKSLFYASVLILPTLLTGCKKDNAPTSSADIVYTNKVFVYDEGRTLQSREGVSISVENSNPFILAQTNSQGEYQISFPSDAIVNKHYGFVYSKPGYGTVRYSLEYMGGRSLGINDINLGAPSTVKVNSFAIVTDGDSLRITINITSPNLIGEKYVRFIHRKNIPGVTYQSDGISGSYVYAVQNGVNHISLHKSVFSNENDAHSGDVIYVKAYGDSFYGNSWLSADGHIIFPNLNNNTSGEASYIQP